MLTIRALLGTDAAAFRAHRLDALRESPEAFGSTYEEDLLLTLDVMANRIAEQTTTPRRISFGAFEDDALVGFVGCAQEGKIKSRHKAMVWGTYVRPEHRGHGIARALMTHLMNYVANWKDVDWLTLSVAGRASAARALYIAFGFKPFGLEVDGLRQNGVSEALEYFALRLRQSDGASFTTS